MSARIMVVHAEPDVLATAAEALRQAGFEVLGFSSTHDALDAFDVEPDIELLVTGIFFGQGKQNGISLALMEKLVRGNLKVLFAASPEYRGQDDGIGEFLPLPLDSDDLVTAVQRLLSPDTNHRAGESEPAGLGRA